MNIVNFPTYYSWKKSYNKKEKCDVVGNGGADKKEIKMVLEKFLKIDLNSIYDDTIDALCLALYNIDQVKIEKLQNRTLSKVSIK